ncbi:PREDICTED: disintegrin and metalloproteinase domain-containing protein 9-like [Nanorana parkeri]|uniref:disintegrin and metalloproteinase domain-containing protein 9-like n=1 Tax=Nanorana parkeri TaxID=125878 RepID=UPI000854C049|nr:PREDICTED: disintegrin and metalloproteinase domain-containing protein 9-like [Nanorana parkeri]
MKLTLSRVMWERQLLLGLLCLLLWGRDVFGLRNEEIVFPEQILARERRDTGQNDTGLWEDSLSYIIPTSNGTLLLNLQRNRDFISKDFEHFTYSKDDGLQKLNRRVSEYNCYYYGQVDGIDDSVVALSTCYGLRGIMYMSELHYGIEPVKNSSNGEHRLYQFEEPDEPAMCGVEDFSTESPESLLSSYFRLRRKKRATLLTPNYVELAVVVDNLRYKMDNSNSTAVEVQTIELINIVDGMFQPLNIRIVITYLLTWITQNPFDVSTGSAGDVLGRFVQWRESTPGLKRCDIYHLLIGHGAFQGGVIGMAFVGTICSPRLGSSISTFSGSPQSHASVVAHELGHILGMNHDDTECKGSYIMHSADIGAKTFSTCSANDFGSLIQRGGGDCLRNPPDPDQVLSIPVCGNNLVEKGEECDCGSPQDCKNPCCNAATCRLTSGSQCAQGLCCDNCKFRVAGTPCRPQANSCDFPEYCNGYYSLCPVDVYVMNGYPCNNGQYYCHGGVCQTFDAQCQALFGPGTRKSVDECFQQVNKLGTQYGNCGIVNGAFKRCLIENSLCGKLQCSGTYNDSLASSIIINNFANVKCVGADFNLGPDVPDPGMVHQGTACGQGKACVNYECVNDTALGFNCDIKGKCNDRGVCNNNGNCHCNDGWAPPNCDRSGYGGSIDSGPTHIDTSLRDGLLVFFLLILPIIILAIVMWIKRDAIRRRCCRKKRRNRHETAQRPIQTTQNYYANQNAASNAPRNQDAAAAHIEVNDGDSGRILLQEDQDAHKSPVCMRPVYK